MIENTWHIIFRLFIQGLIQFLIILVSGLLPFVILTLVSGYFNSLSLKRMVEFFGFKVLYLTGWLGVPIHELSHLVAALFSGHKITKFQPLSLNEQSGQLGVVETSYSKSNWYQRFVGGFLIPIAPIIGGTFFLYLIIVGFFPTFNFARSIQYQIPSSNDFDRVIPWLYYVGQMVYAIILTISKLWNSIGFNDWKTYLGFYGVVCISLHLFPSSTDWKNFRFSLIVLIVTAFIGSILISFLQLTNTIFFFWTFILILVLPVWFFTIGVTWIVSIFILLLTWVLKFLFHRTNKEA